MKTRRLHFIILSFLICLAILAGCGGPAKSTPEPATPAASEPATAPESTTPPETTTKPVYSKGASDTTIKIGNTGPQSGPVAALGGNARGLDAFFRYVNDNGGVNGRMIEFIYMDDGYSPESAVANIKKLVEQDGVFAICGALGTSCIKAYSGYLLEKGIPNVSIAAGASTFTDPVIPNLFVSALNYNVEGQMLAKYAVEDLGAEKIGVFYQNDDFGKDYLSGITKYLESKGMEVAVTASYNTTDVDYTTQAMAMQQAEVDTVIMAAMKTQAAAFVLEMEKIGVLEKINLLANNSAGDDPLVMQDLCGEAWNGTYVSTFLPDFTQDTEEFNVFREYVEKHYPNDLKAPSTLFFGWQEGEILVEALKRCGDELTHENLIKQLETFDDWSGKYIYHITYTPEEHIGSRCMRICKAIDGVNTAYSDWIVF